jgi:hypothetical protein
MNVAIFLRASPNMAIGGALGCDGWQHDIAAQSWQEAHYPRISRFWLSSRRATAPSITHTKQSMAITAAFRWLGCENLSDTPRVQACLELRAKVVQLFCIQIADGDGIEPALAPAINVETAYRFHTRFLQRRAGALHHE